MTPARTGNQRARKQDLRGERCARRQQMAGDVDIMELAGEGRRGQMWGWAAGLLWAGWGPGGILHSLSVAG